MPMSQWPCQPDRLADFMDDALIRYILAGAAERYRLPLTIVDEDTRPDCRDAYTRYDPFNPRQQASSFCTRLRGSPYENLAGISGADEECRNWDNVHAREALQEPTLALGEPQHIPCWLNLSDYVTLLSVAHHRFVLFTGQMLPADGKDAATLRIEGSVREQLGVPAGRQPASPAEIEQLLEQIPKLPVADDSLQARIKQCSQDIQQQFLDHWQLRRDALEDGIYRDVVTAAEGLGMCEDNRRWLDWTKVDTLLARLCERLDCRLVVLFAHDSHRGRNHQGSNNVLRLRAAGGLSPSMRGTPPHFNWNKSRIAECGEDCGLDPAAARISQRGIRGDTAPWLASIEMWYWLSDERTGCRSVIGLGGLGRPDMAKGRVDFLKQLLSALTRRIHSLQLHAEIYHAEDLNRELAAFLAHQVGSRMQTFRGFQTIFQRLSRGREPQEDFARASARLNQAIEDLATMTKVVHAEQPTLYDPEAMDFEQIDPWSAIEAAVEDQAAYAEQQGMRFRYAAKSLPAIRADVFWLRIMLGHLLNNAIKYSRLAKDGRSRWIAISAEHYGNQLQISIENFGLGIEGHDLERIFARGGSARQGVFAGRPGEGRGLYEATRIAVAHRGTIGAYSRHYSGGPVRRDYIEECITTFTVTMNLA